MSHSIVLATLNARYIHCAFGLRYLLANMGTLQEQTSLQEYGIKQRPIDIAEQILAHQPQIVGLGVYIWNAEQTLKLAQVLKGLAPDVKLVLGGPEVSYETGEQALAQLADVVITGEADLVFPAVCQSLLRGESVEHIIAAAPPEMDQVKLPYHLYSDHDLAQRVIYVEASRGCPFQCEFCLSSLDIPVRRPDLDPFLAAMKDLMDRGARHFKFVDRTFNLNLKLTLAILAFFESHYREGLFLHFEMVPDRLPDALREHIKRFPDGALQFEVGIQTFHPDVAQRITLRRDHTRTEDNLRFLKEETGVHVHADLIAGLPGEDMQSFGSGFDRLLGMGPEEIQVGILKRLRGTPIIRHEDPFQMVFSPFPPYEILSTSTLDFKELQRIRRFAELWDRVGNSGRFTQTCKYLLNGPSAFECFMGFADWLGSQTPTVHDIGLDRLGRFLLVYLTEEKACSPDLVREALASDLSNLGRHQPGWLKRSGKKQDSASREKTPHTGRQFRHQQGEQAVS